MIEITALPRQKGETIRSWVHKCLETGIVALELLPGQLLVEQDICDSLKVSHTPVRDALFQLSQEHFVTVVPQTRTNVSLIDLQLVEETRYVRCCVERDIIRRHGPQFDDEVMAELQHNVNQQERANQKSNLRKIYELDDALHALFFQAAGLPKLWERISKQNLHFARVKELYLRNHTQTEHIVVQHQALVAALASHDYTLAEQLVDEHLSPAGWNIMDMKAAYPDLFQ